VWKSELLPEDTVGGRLVLEIDPGLGELAVGDRRAVSETEITGLTAGGQPPE
jgi:hypothetical protein